MYCHPGRAFLQQLGASGAHRSLQGEADVRRYVEFLRSQSGMDDKPPIDLSTIYRHFHIPAPRRVPLEEQQGILVNSETGIILIKEDDAIARQRFTEGHELMELLFDALEDSLGDSLGGYPVTWQASYKEKLCDRGAACLLLPETSLLPQLQKLGFNLETVRMLSQQYATSLLATLLRLLELDTGDRAMVVWHRSLKPSEMHQSSGVRKWRVWWQVRSSHWTGGFIPKDKSAPEDSIICRTHETAKALYGVETLPWGTNATRCGIETMPVRIGAKNCVLSLLHRDSS